MKYTWNGGRAKQQLIKAIAKNLPAAAESLQDDMKAMIAIQGPPTSSPGEPPHIDTQALYDSIDVAIDARGLSFAVGSELPYAAYLESGTDRMAPRPFLSRTLVQWGDVAARHLLNI